ncbi:C39 family peptidase [Heyndrickxia acidicola]|uniref:C39 family peptidase n=1 Tax=Heyndrickxia acidicola TaxID=209389 RepID=A0ABU6MIP0_9BACI|nr:C39 family peptidase [Heyndrickxia acidicola]MED1203102.1 C39 family peptidase [Heyndrickxia acidicola]
MNRNIQKPLIFIVLLLFWLTTSQTQAAAKTSNPLNVPILNQLAAPRLYNGCEITSLTMMMNYNSVNVNKLQLANQVSYVPFRYNNGLRGNPNVGFVGDMVHGPGLAVYHQPIYNLTKRYVGRRAQDLTGRSITDIYKKIDEGSPVWVITTTSFAPVYNFQYWYTPQGTIRVTFSEHSVLLTGYSKYYVYVNDPYGYKNRRLNRTSFEAAWVQMGRQAVVIN